MDFSPERSLGNSQVTSALRIEAPFAVRLHQRVPHRGTGPVLHGEGNDRVILALESLARIELANLDCECQSIDAELLRAFEVSCRALRSPESQGVSAALQRNRAHQPDHTDDVIGMKVREKGGVQRERRAVTHHLSLSA